MKSVEIMRDIPQTLTMISILGKLHLSAYCGSGGIGLPWAVPDCHL